MNIMNIIFLILMIYALLPAGFAFLYLFGYVYSFAELIQPYNLSILAGAAAYVVFMSQFLLSARIKFLERRIPQDRLLALHGAAGTASFALVCVHFIIKFLTIIRYAGISLQSAAGTFALLCLTVLSPMAYMVLRGKGRKKNQSPPYAGVKKGHNLFALAGLAVVIHVMLASSTWSAALRIFTLAWGAVTLSAYIRHKLIRPRGRAELKLVRVEELTPDVHRYTFDGEASHRSGQFGYFSFDSAVPGAEEHPFTIASAEGGPVQIVVRSAGDFTAALPKAPEGTLVKMDGPYGRFSPSRFPEGTPVIFLAAGIGITPALSLATDPGIRALYPLTILWSIRDDEDTKIGALLKALADSGEIRFSMRFSRTEGRIDGEFLDTEIPAESESAGPAVYFICGPEDFGKTMRKLLKQRGVEKRNIIEERFSW